MPSKADLNIYQGDDYAAVVTVSNGSTPPDQVLAGYAAQAQIRTGVADKQTTVACEILTTVSSPYVNLSIPHALTMALKGRYVWDLQLIDPSGLITTILSGAVTVTQEVTRE
jgi:hypothetical protein